MIIIERLSKTTQDEDMATVELRSYKMADGLFGSTGAIRQMRTVERLDMQKLFGTHPLLFGAALYIGQNMEVSEHLTALVVDDSRVIRMVHRKLLNAIGVKIQEVENGKEAVDVHNLGQKFDLILMDRDMPLMNGVEATKELRSMEVDSMIVGVSTRIKEAHVEEFMEAGLDVYFEKPLNRDKLDSIIHKIQKLPPTES
ncbi:hypothetical protein RJT34_18940 [Clitoria ternatea]|uniref:Response regulatory domain-containing protein n=1 Tax=Clitoria ternatea TaxID=43366 RepID=A0AAN9IQ39_CLITE